MDPTEFEPTLEIDLDDTIVMEETVEPENTEYYKKNDSAGRNMLNEMRMNNSLHSMSNRAPKPIIRTQYAASSYQVEDTHMQKTVYDQVSRQ